MTACGLDFGTSNTTLGIVNAAGPALLPLEGTSVTLPSAVFYGRDRSRHFGRAAIGAYVEGTDGRLMRSLKSVLGSALVDETTQVGRDRLKFRDVIAGYVAEARRRAETASQRELSRVVHGRPVFFVDDDVAGNARAEAVLAEIAREAGFAEVSFQYEPIAAALDYERHADREQLALIADIGGGTSDFSIVRIGPERRGREDRASDILANDGVRIGGVDFDRLLSLSTVMPLLGYRSPMRAKNTLVPNGPYLDLATWSAINRLYDAKVLRALAELARDAAMPDLIERLITVVEGQRGHTLAIAVEAAKIALSDVDETTIDLAWIEADLAATVTDADLDRHTATLAERIANRIRLCLTTAGLAAGDIDAVFLTGGSTRLANVRAAILAEIPAARVVEGDTFGSVGTGLAIEAARRYG
ncbi:Hsp70 family protein [Methylobrevis pamukkalensis]|uniref:Chaperone protein DnaK n=1 Tax=Methylobrevis pamukkalensis TaxID=1439726 RepID=A0A1E3H5V7_9HYPH|nr:Hsp70 family protein [Methylobrevis pamukkalensis]ODN71694.1 Chaperone protein DnaK [Methylobrevis pamukkalensis]